MELQNRIQGKNRLIYQLLCKYPGTLLHSSERFPFKKVRVFVRLLLRNWLTLHFCMGTSNWLQWKRVVRIYLIQWIDFNNTLIKQSPGVKWFGDVVKLTPLRKPQQTNSSPPSLSLKKYTYINIKNCQSSNCNMSLKNVQGSQNYPYMFFILANQSIIECMQSVKNRIFLNKLFKIRSEWKTT